jgi:hypothetical protein
MGRFLTGFGAAVLVAGAAWFFTGAAPTGAQEKNKGGAAPRVVWEYKVYYHDKNPQVEERVLNEQGAEGWELVTSYPIGGDGAHVFKRQKR